MKNIFIGFLLIFLDFNLNLDSSRIGLIPDFLGYIAMINGLVEMARESQLFMKVKPYAIGMAVFFGISYLMDLMGISSSLGPLFYILAITSTVISLYISYNIIMGVIEIEKKYDILLNGDRLISTWKLLAALNIATFIFLLLIPPLAFICIIVTFIAALYFLSAFNKSKNSYYLYYDMK